MADSSPLASPPSTGSVTGVPLDQAHRGITLVGAVKRFVRKYATFEGRASRSEFWWVMLVLAIVVLFLGFLGDVGTYLTAAFLVAMVVPFLALGARRLHDVGEPGWSLLIGLVPCLGLVLYIYWAMPENAKGDKYDVY